MRRPGALKAVLAEHGLTDAEVLRRHGLRDRPLQWRRAGRLGPFLLGELLIVSGAVRGGFTHRGRFSKEVGLGCKSSDAYFCPGAT